MDAKEENNELKANRRLPLWAREPNGKAHRIIRAFLRADNGNGVASIECMLAFCSDEATYANTYVANFDVWLRDLCTEAGNSSGKVFEMIDGNHVVIWPPIAHAFNVSRQAFEQ